MQNYSGLYFQASFCERYAFAERFSDDSDNFSSGIWCSPLEIIDLSKMGNGGKRTSPGVWVGC